MDYNGVKIVMRAPADDKLEIDVMNEIVHDNWGGWLDGTTAKNFSEQLAGKSAKNITVRINSNGGSVSDGVTIYNLLRERARAGAKITTINMGMAASIASVIFMAGDVRRAATGSRTMIHNAGIAGYVPYMNSADLRKTADDLEQINNSIAEIYAQSSNWKKSKDDFLALMASETTLSASESVDHGLATETDPELQAVALGASFAVVARGAADTHNPQQEKPEMSITMEKLVAEHPEIVAALRQEGREQATSEVVAAVTTRIQNVLALKEEIPGYEEQINAWAYDGKTTAEMAKARLFDLETKARKEAGIVLRTPSASTATVPAAAPVDRVSAVAGSQGEKGEKPAAPQASADPLEPRCKKEWDAATPEFRASFIDDFNVYMATRKAEIRNGRE